MAFVAVAGTVGAAVGLSGTAAIIGGGALIGAGVGGLYSAVTGDGDILNSMLTGGLIGGAGAFGLNAMGVGAGATATAAEAATAAGATGAGTVGPAATTVATTTPAMEAAALLDAAAVAEGGAQAGMATQYAAQEAAKQEAAKVAAKALTSKEVLGYGLAGTTAMQLLGGKGKGGIAPASATDPGTIRPYTFTPNQMAQGSEYPSPYATAQYDAAGMPIMDTRERNYFDQKYTAQTPYSARVGTVNPNVPVAAARGGLMAVGGPVERMSQNVMGGQSNMYPQSQQPVTSFATPTQMPVSAEIVRSDYDAQTRPYSGITMAEGGLSSIGYKGYGQTEENSIGRPNPVGEYLVNQIFNKPTAPSTNVLGNTGSSAEPSSSSSNSTESNPILRAMYDKQLQNPDYEFTQPELVSGWQAYNPNAFRYDPTAKKYSAANPNEQQLSSFKQQMADYMAQDRASKAAAQGVQSFDSGGGGANGGLMPYDLGGYSDGGRLLRGPGDGVSDDIPATIAGKQPARLADGEFVIPARIVSEIGNGSTDAGAKRLYAMMDKIQAGRKKTVGKGNIAKDTKAKKHLLA
jgi:hypothetical protein